MALWFCGFVLCIPGLLHRYRRRSVVFVDVIFVFAVVLAAIFPFLPWDINGAGLFNIRLTIFCPLLLLAAASRSHTKFLPAIACAGTLIGILLFARLNAQVYPRAEQAAILEHVSTPAAVTVMGLTQTYSQINVLNFDPYYWTSARLARRKQSVLVNGPWLELPTIMLGRKAGWFADTKDEDPKDLLEYMNKGAQKRSRLLNMDSLVLVSDCGDPKTSIPDAWLPSDSRARLFLNNGCFKLYKYQPEALVARLNGSD